MSEKMAGKEEFASVGLVPGLSRTEIIVCQVFDRLNSQGCAWQGGDVFSFTMPLAFAQLILIFAVSRTIYLVLKPLKQSMITAHLIGGIIVGQTFLGHNREFSELLFPIQGRVVLETIGEIGFMLHLFILGVNTDATMVKRAGKKEVIIGASCFVLPYVLSGVIVRILPNLMLVDDVTQHCLIFISMLSAVSTFPVITSLLAELNLLNSEVGRMATTASMICDFCSYFSSLIMGLLGLTTQFARYSVFLSVAWTVACLVVVVLFCRPIILLIGRRIPENGSMKESQFLSIIVVVLFCGFLSEILGQPACLGTFILGIAVPDGPPLGSSLVYKIDLFCSVVLLPAKFAVCGLDMDLRTAGRKGISAIIMESVILLGYIGKFAGTFIPAVFVGFSVSDATSLSLIMCYKGIIDMAIFIAMKENAMLNSEALGLLFCTMLVVMGTVPPLVGYLYDPSTRYIGYRTNSILHSDPHSELRMLVCVHNEDNVPTLINLLEISCAGRARPFSVSILTLTELKGRADALLLPGSTRAKGKLRATRSHSDRVYNAFEGFKQRNHGHAMVGIFTSVAPYASMHDDICTMALEKGANIVIVPFHKQISFNGDTISIQPAIRMVNQNVLQKAPCSVGVLIDRGNVTENQSVNLGHAFRVTMLFFGGLDDREALAYSFRLADHSHVTLTLVWIRKLSDRQQDNTGDPEKALDEEMIHKFRATHLGFNRITYKEEAAVDAVDTTRVLRELKDKCDLCIVGRYHDPNSELTFGITEWTECPELGVIGDMLATPDFKFSVLVVQQLPQGTAPVQGNALQSIACNSNDSEVFRPSI